MYMQSSLTAWALESGPITGRRGKNGVFSVGVLPVNGGGAVVQRLWCPAGPHGAASP